MLSIASLGLFGALFFKFFVLKKFQPNFSWHQKFEVQTHDQCMHTQHELHLHNHSSLKEKTIAIYLLLSHRVIAGIFLGYVAYQNAIGAEDGVKIAYFIAFFLHLIPEEVVIFYRLQAAGVSRNRALLYSILMLFLLVPFMFLGANVASSINQIEVLEASLHILIAVLFVFAALFEFFPEILVSVQTYRD